MTIPWHTLPFRHLSLVCSITINSMNIMWINEKKPDFQRRERSPTDFISCAHLDGCADAWIIKSKKNWTLSNTYFHRQSLTLKTSVQVGKHQMPMWLSTHTSMHAEIGKVLTSSIQRRDLSSHFSVWALAKYNKNASVKRNRYIIVRGQTCPSPYYHLLNLKVLKVWYILLFISAFFPLQWRVFFPICFFDIMFY